MYVFWIDMPATLVFTLILITQGIFIYLLRKFMSRIHVTEYETEMVVEEPKEISGNIENTFEEVDKR